MKLQMTVDLTHVGLSKDEIEKLVTHSLFHEGMTILVKGVDGEKRIWFTTESIEVLSDEEIQHE